MHQSGSIEDLKGDFLTEAGRLWTLVKDRDLITNIQSAILLAILYQNEGMDRKAELHREYAIDVVERLDFMDINTTQDAGWYATLAFTTWGLFCWQSYVVPYQNNHA